MRIVVRTVLAVALTFSWLLSNTGLVIAATQGSCPSTDTTKVLLYENAVGDLSDGDDRLWKCTGDPDLGNDSHTPAGNCHSPLLGSATWSDCVSSYTG